MPREIDWTGAFIALCFAIFVVFWIVAAFSTKRTVQSNYWWRAAMLIVAALTVVLVRLNRGQLGWLRTLLWRRTLTTGLIADAVALAGLLIMLWARVVLAGNWSGGVVLKQDHELVTRGPYRFVRHPIYSGLLLLLLAWAIWAGGVRGFVFWGFAAVLLWTKALAEEKLLTQHFGAGYRNYKARVKALVPYVL